MEKLIKVIYKAPGEGAKFAIIENTLDRLQYLVGGDIKAYCIGEDLEIICNKDGKLKGLEANCIIGGELFVGPIIFCGTKGDEFCDIPVGIDGFRLLFPDISAGGFTDGTSMRELIYEAINKAIAKAQADKADACRCYDETNALYLQAKATLEDADCKKVSKKELRELNSARLNSLNAYTEAIGRLDGTKELAFEIQKILSYRG